MEQLERIVGHDRSLPRSFVERALAVSQAVGRITITEHGGSSRSLGYASGFVLSPHLALTCHHIVPDEVTAERSYLELDFFERGDGTFAQPIKIRFAPGVFFATSPSLDVTLVGLDPRGARSLAADTRTYVALPSTSGRAIKGQKANIIHYPHGEPQAMSLRDCEVVGVLEDWVHYTHTTSGGSVGAPVFNDYWELIAVHHSRVPMRDDQGSILTMDGKSWDGGDASAASIQWMAAEGVRASSITSWVATLGIPEALLGGQVVEAVGRAEGRPNAPVASASMSSAAASIEPADDVRDGVFISYAHEDQKKHRWHERLELHLRGIDAVGPRRVWQDGRIRAGSDWQTEIEQALRKTKVAVFLVGPHFLVSDFIKEKELLPLLTAAQTEGVRVFPFATHNVAYRRTFMGRFQFFGDPEEPLENLALGQQNRALVELVRAIAEVYEAARA